MPQDAFDPLAAPYDAVVRITEVFDGQTWQGSGVLLSPDEVLTVGHIAYRTGSAAPTDIRVSENSTNSAAMVAGVVAHTGPIVVNEPGLALADVANDYSLLHLSVPILGAATMQVVAGANIETAHITGFPGTAGGAMVSDTQTISAIPEIDNVYRVSSEGSLLSPGISGAPLWMTDASGQPVVMGIVSAQDSAGDYAVQFNPAVADQINAWVAADHYVPPAVAAAPAPTPPPIVVSQPVPVVVDTPHTHMSAPAPAPAPTTPVAILPTPIPAPAPTDPAQAPITPVNIAPDPDLAFIKDQYTADTSGHTASVVRLYHAALGRLPDLGGMQFWVNDLNEGYSLTVLADGFQNAAEFIARFGGTNIPNADFVSHIYEGVLGREPEAGGYQFWSQNLDSGASSRSQTLALISESAENRAITAQMFGLTG